jgi:hypothetical protein
LTVAPRHLRRFAIGDKSHGAAEAPALNLIAHVFILPSVGATHRILGLRRAKREGNIADGQLLLGKRAKYCDPPTAWTIPRSFRPSGRRGRRKRRPGDDACWLRQHRPREISCSGRGALESAFRRGSTILRKRSSRTYCTDACQVNLGSLCPASRSWTFASSQSRSISLRLAPSGVWPPSAKRISI